MSTIVLYYVIIQDLFEYHGKMVQILYCDIVIIGAELLNDASAIIEQYVLTSTAPNIMISQ